MHLWLHDSHFRNSPRLRGTSFPDSDRRRMAKFMLSSSRAFALYFKLIPTEVPYSIVACPVGCKAGCVRYSCGRGAEGSATHPFTRTQGWVVWPVFFLLKIGNEVPMGGAERKLRIQIDSASTSAYTGANQEAQIRNCTRYP